MIGESYVMERIDAIWSSSDDAQKRRYTGGLRSFSPEKSNIFSYSCPYEFKKTVGHLNSAQKHCVKAIGMESLLDLKCNLVCRTLVAELVKCIDPSSGDLVVHGSAFHLLAESFSDVMGLRNEKQDMVVALDRPELVNDVLEIVAPKGSEINISKLRDYIVASQEGDDIFKVVFALYAYGTLLCPTATGTVNRDIIPQLQDSSVMWRIDWATRSIAHLLDGVQIYQTSGEDYFAGSMIYLQLFYFQKLAKKLYLITGDIPAYKYWSRNSVKWLIKWVANHGGFSCSLVLNFSQEDPVSAGKYMALWSELERNKAELERSKAELERNKNMDLKVNELVEARVKVVLANYGIGEPDIGVKKEKARNPFGYKSDRVVDKGEQMGSVFAEAMCEDQICYMHQVIWF